MRKTDLERVYEQGTDLFKTDQPIHELWNDLPPAGHIHIVVKSQREMEGLGARTSLLLAWLQLDLTLILATPSSNHLDLEPVDTYLLEQFQDTLIHQGARFWSLGRSRGL